MLFEAHLLKPIHALYSTNCHVLTETSETKLAQKKAFVFQLRLVFVRNEIVTTDFVSYC